MREHDVQDILLVRAFDEADADRRVLTAADYAAARAAESAAAPSDPPQQPLALWIEKYGPIAGRLKERIPGIEHFAAFMRCERGWTPLFAVTALVFGIAGHALGPSQRFNVLQMPLLGVCLWNFVVYALVARAAFKRSPGGSGSAAPSGWSGWLYGAARLVFEKIIHIGLKRHGPAAEPTAKALVIFGREWKSVAGGLVAKRLLTAMHVAAAALAVGLVIGMYLRGLTAKYEATWESTFLGRDHVESLLRFLLGPASLLTGVKIVVPGESATVGAASWIHLYAASAVLYVVAPRLLLAMVAARSTKVAAKKIDIDLSHPYFRRASAAVGIPLEVSSSHTIAFSFHPPPRTRENVNDMSVRLFGPRVRLADPIVVEYADERDDVRKKLAAHAADPKDRSAAWVLLFSLTQTPEFEVHGRFADELQKDIASREKLVVIDISAFVAQTPDPARREGREAAWKAVLDQVGIRPIFINFDRPLEAATIEKIHGHARTGASKKEAAWKK